MEYNSFHQMYNIWKIEAQNVREKSRPQRPEYHLLESINSMSEQQRAKISIMESSSLGIEPIFVQPISADRPCPNVTSVPNRDMVSIFSNTEVSIVHQVLKCIKL